jgi:hypothetical protein
MKYRIKIIRPSQQVDRLRLDSVLNRVSTGFEFEHLTHKVIIRTNSIAWFATAVELLEAGKFAWEATSGE